MPAASDRSFVSCRNVCQGARQLPTESEFDDAAIRVEFRVASDEVVQSLCRHQSRAEQPRKSTQPHVEHSRDMACNSRCCGEPTQRRPGNSAHEFAEPCEEKNRQTEPLGESESDGVCTEVVTEFVCHDAEQFVVVEIRKCKGTHDEDVSAARECVHIVAFVDGEHEVALRCSCGRKDHSCGAVESTPFDGGRFADTQHACHEDSLSGGQKHHDRGKCRDGDEDRIRGVERNRNDEPDQARGGEPCGQQRDNGDDGGEGRRVDESFTPPRHAIEARQCPLAVLSTLTE